MPTISVDKAELFKALGKESVSPTLSPAPAQLLQRAIHGTYRNPMSGSAGAAYTTEEFDELCFEFGMLALVTTNSKRPIVDGVEEPPQLKIEIPANRHALPHFDT
ncbi:putative phenylalanyl-trna beta subunit protein [Lasiodiplodia theobromae]|nr:putative phenylalanyl-trna beta subunit protein [Lasiodiplodia theobromae]